MRQIRKWPTLYKLSKSTGKTLVWKIWTEGATIHTESGFKGQKMKSSKDVLTKGKNIGRVSETTAEEQAEFQAGSEHRKYLDKGYSPDLKKTKEGISPIGKTPMLAHDYLKHGKRLSFPVYGQPKLDGMRAMFEEEKFISRNRKPLAALPALSAIVEDLQEEMGYPVDGELYNDKYKTGFTKIISGAKTLKEKNKLEDEIHYHIYDIIAPDLTFEERHEIIKYVLPPSFGGKVFRVETILIETPEELEAYAKLNLKLGYEGTIVRDRFGKYEIATRSYTLQKYKPWEDSEFRIVGIEEGVGRTRGAVGAFILEMDDERGKRTFKSTITGKGADAFKKKAFKDHSIWKGKWMNVRYRGLTDKNFLPKENRSMGIREEE